MEACLPLGCWFLEGGPRPLELGPQQGVTGGVDHRGRSPGSGFVCGYQWGRGDQLLLTQQSSVLSSTGLGTSHLISSRIRENCNITAGEDCIKPSFFLQWGNKVVNNHLNLHGVWLFTKYFLKIFYPYRDPTGQRGRGPVYSGVADKCGEAVGLSKAQATVQLDWKADFLAPWGEGLLPLYPSVFHK